MSQHDPPMFHYICTTIAGICNTFRAHLAHFFQKKLKDKAFAAKVDREIIRNSVELLGVGLDEHIRFVIEAMKPRAVELGLAGTGSGGAGESTSGGDG